MTSPEKKRAVLYAREVPEPEPDPERFIYLFDKWDGLSKALDADADLVAVSFPEVLGDNYTELVINLGRIAPLFYDFVHGGPLYWPVRRRRQSPI